MLRNLLPLLALALTPADYTVCTKIDNGPIVNQKPPVPFARQPDFAAMTAYPRTFVFDGMPPPRLRSPLKMTVETGAVAKCGTPSPGHVFEACERDGTVFLPNPCSYGDREEFARLFCHEQAHLQSWPADHGP